MSDVTPHVRCVTCNAKNPIDRVSCRTCGSALPFPLVDIPVERPRKPGEPQTYVFTDDETRTTDLQLSEAEQERIAANQKILRTELAEFREHYWPIFKERGEPITFGEAFLFHRLMCIEGWLRPNDPDADAPWRNS